jgi:hypothetical protein
MLGHGKNIAWIDALVGYANAVDLDAVAALEVANVPVSGLDVQLAVLGRHVGEPENDVATLATPNKQTPLK